MCKQVQFGEESVWGRNQNQLRSSLSLIITKTIKKFQPLAHKTLLLILASFSGNMPLCVTGSPIISNTTVYTCLRTCNTCAYMFVVKKNYS